MLGVAWVGKTVHPSKNFVVQTFARHFHIGRKVLNDLFGDVFFGSKQAQYIAIQGLQFFHILYRHAVVHHGANRLFATQDGRLQRPAAAKAPTHVGNFGFFPGHRHGTFHDALQACFLDTAHETTRFFGVCCDLAIVHVEGNYVDRTAQVGVKNIRLLFDVVIQAPPFLVYKQPLVRFFLGFDHVTISRLTVRRFETYTAAHFGVVQGQWRGV